MWCERCQADVKAESGGSSGGMRCEHCGHQLSSAQKHNDAIRQARAILERWQSSSLIEQIHSTPELPPLMWGHSPAESHPKPHDALSVEHPAPDFTAPDLTEPDVTKPKVLEPQIPAQRDELTESEMGRSQAIVESEDEQPGTYTRAAMLREVARLWKLPRRKKWPRQQQSHRNRYSCQFLHSPQVLRTPTNRPQVNQC